MLFPRVANKPKAGDSSAADLKAAQQLTTKAVMPITKAKAAVEMVAVTADMKSAKAFATLRLERMNQRRAGVRAKRAAEAEKAEKDK